MSVRRSLAWSYASQISAYAVTFAVSLVVARLLSPSEVGEFAVATAVAGVLSIVSAFGVGPYLVREATVTPAKTATAFTVNAIVNLILGLVIAATAVLGARLFSDPAIGRVLILLAALPVLGIFEFLPITLLTRDVNFGVVSGITLLRVILNNIIVVVLALRGWSSLSLAAGALSAGLFSVVAYTVVARRHMSLRLSLQGWREIAVFGLQMMSIGGVAATVARLSEIALAKISGLAAMGLYARASGISNLTWETYGVATKVIFVQMAAEQRQSGTVRQTFVRGIQMLTAIMWPCMIGLAVLSRPFVHWFYGDRWLAAALPLSILMLAQAVALSFGMNWELCVLTRRTAWQARVEVTRSVIGALAFCLGAVVGLAAASAGRLVESLIGLMFYRGKMPAMAGSPPGELGRVYAQSVGLTLAAVTPSGGLMLFTGWSATTNPLAILATVILGGAVWMALLARGDHPLMAELKLSVSMLVGKRVQG